MIFRKLIQYFQSSYQELKKVTWPSRRDLIRYLITVVVCLVLATGFIMLIDYGFSWLIRLIFQQS